jgi:hypothetical protein
VLVGAYEMFINNRAHDTSGLGTNQLHGIISIAMNEPNRS